MHPCNRGETPTRSVQENAANRTAATTTRAQFCERTKLFIALRSSDSGARCASNFLSEISFYASQKRRGDAYALQSFRKIQESLLGISHAVLWSAMRPRIAFIVNRPIWCQVRLWFGRQHHDWSLTLSMLRVRGPFPPIWCSHSIGLDLTGPGSNGDAPDGASTPGSCRDQTLVLLR
jgi:hypothetical protein